MICTTFFTLLQYLIEMVDNLVIEFDFVNNGKKIYNNVTKHIIFDM